VGGRRLVVVAGYAFSLTLKEACDLTLKEAYDILYRREMGNPLCLDEYGWLSVSGQSPYSFRV